MAKFNTTTTRPATGRSPIGSQATRTTVNHEGAAAYARGAKSELFLLAVANFVGQSTFYETGNDRDERYAALVREVAIADPVWVVEFLRWLRADGNMRTAPLVGAAEFVKARLDAKAPSVPAYDVPGWGNDRGLERSIVDAVLQRADEPGEALAYWTSRYGRRIPKPVKRGIADAVRRLYNERNLLKYDTASKGYRFGDVLELVHAEPSAAWQGHLFKHAIDRRHGRENHVPIELAMLTANALLRAVAASDPMVLLDADRLREAGMTWEDALSLAGSKVDKSKLWEALIPSMAYMALLRNLRNFDEAGVSDEAAEQVAARLANPDEVARSRQFPFRFYAAHLAVGSLRWGAALERALSASLANVPALSGRTLVLVDQSPSMFPGYGFSTRQVRSDMTNADMAKLFGSAIALRATDATLAGYGQTSYQVDFRRGDAVLRVMERFRVENGTDTFGAIAAHFDGHDRVIVVTDEQNQSSRYISVDEVLPRHVPVHLWNIGGFAAGSIGSGSNRNTIGGMTDAAFRMVPLLEGGRDGAWPWAASA